MKKRNIFKSDNILIPFGWIFLVLALLVSITLFPDKNNSRSPEKRNSDLCVTLFFAAGAAAFLTMGYKVRAKEKRINAILNSLEHMHEIHANDIIGSTGFNEKILQESLIFINRQGYGFYIWDKQTGMIRDGRLNRQMIMVEDCESCGKKISQSYPLGLTEAPHCPYCGSPMDMAQWNNLKMKAFNELDQAQAASGQFVFSLKPKKFSVVLFIILLISFWPLAIGYYIKCSLART